MKEKFRSLLFFIAKNFHKVSGGFLFVMPNPLRVTTLDWFGKFPYNIFVFWLTFFLFYGIILIATQHNNDDSFYLNGRSIHFYYSVKVHTLFSCAFPYGCYRSCVTAIRVMQSTISSRPERVIGHIGTETRSKLLREAAVGNIGQWAQA